MEYLEVKKWLNRAFYAEKKAKALENVVKQCRERAQSASICYENSDKGKSGSSSNYTEKALMRIADLEHRLTEQIFELCDISDEILDVINRIGEPGLEAVLIERYINFHTIEETAEILNYSPETVKRKQRKAIEKLTPFDLV